MITVDNRQKDFNLNEGWLMGLSREIMAFLKLADLELSVSLVDSKEMSKLNSKYLGKEGLTDVLAFPLSGGVGSDGLKDENPGQVKDLLGDVIICPSAVKGDDAEIAKLLVHGVLHLAGYDHYEPQEKKEMFDLQDEILAKITK